MGFDSEVMFLVKKIPRGKVTTYKEMGRALGSRGYRSVGQALKRNPRPVVIPCHRVVNSDGSIGGYHGKSDSDEKERILREEGVEIRQGKINLKKHFFRMV